MSHPSFFDDRDALRIAAVKYYAKAKRERRYPLIHSQSESEVVGDQVFIRNCNGNLAIYDLRKRRFIS